MPTLQQARYGSGRSYHLHAGKFPFFSFFFFFLIQRLTLFSKLQPHVAWHWVFLPRLENLLKPNTGFMSFGPYINQTCGIDSTEQTFPRMADIYSAFRGDLCPPIPQLVSLSVFVVHVRVRGDGKWKGRRKEGNREEDVQEEINEMMAELHYGRPPGQVNSLSPKSVSLKINSVYTRTSGANFMPRPSIGYGRKDGGIVILRIRL